MSEPQRLESSFSQEAVDFLHQQNRFLRPCAVSLRSQANIDSLPLVENIAAALNLSRITAQVLVGRGITSTEEARSFLQPTLRDNLPDPAKLPNIEQALALIIDHIQRQELITIYSDFDVDGLTAAAQLALYLQALGARVSHYTPNRFTEGYGLVASAVQKLHRGGSKLLIALDCGTTNQTELRLAQRLGLKTIVIDHHQLSVECPADVLVNPLLDEAGFGAHQLCTAGIVWMFLIHLRRRLSEDETLCQGLVGVETLPEPKDFLDLAALGTLCDMVPLRGLNRLIAHRGLEALRHSNRLGICALKKVSGLNSPKQLNAGHILFALGPRINAAGRLEDGSLVYELLTTNSAKKAESIARLLDRLNEKRRAIEEEVRISCLNILAQRPDLAKRPAFALFGDDFHVGVIGIAAQRLVEQFHVPATVMALSETVIDGKVRQVVKGSVRSIPGFHVANALEALDHYLLGHGGHAQAGGFSLACNKVTEFAEAFVTYAEKTLSPEMLKRHRQADAVISFADIDYKLVEELNLLQPFGIGNPAPVLVCYGVNISSIQGLANGHYRLRLSNGERSLQAVAWRFKGHPLLETNRKVNIAFQPEINTYQGLSTVQLNIKELWEDSDNGFGA